MVVVGVDGGGDLVRSTFPKLMPDHCRVWSASCPRLAGLGVSAMTVYHEDPREPLANQRVDDIREDRDQRGLQERGAAAWVRGEAGHAEWQHRQHRDPERLGGLDRRALGKDVVGLKRELRMLFGRADGEHDPVVAAQVRLELHPVEVADPHRDARTLTPKPNPRLGECSRMSLERRLR
jgi:hypothetical protein